MLLQHIASRFADKFSGNISAIWHNYYLLRKMYQFTNISTNNAESNIYYHYDVIVVVKQ